MNINSYEDQPTSLRQKTVYLRSYVRNIPSQPLQPYLDARPVMTKYSTLPIVDPRKEINTPLIQRSTYSTDAIFNPGNDFGPWSGYSSNINRESELRGQIFALQDCSQSKYVPSSKSSLYEIKFIDNNQSQPFPNLFKTEKFNEIDPNPNKDKIGYSLFNNATRQQTKDLTKTTC
jgi:hypothetical protein